MNENILTERLLAIDKLRRIEVKRLKWKKFRLKTTTIACDLVVDMLMELGINGAEIEDKVPLTESDKKKMFVDILPDGPADDGIAYVSFYFEEDEDETEKMAKIKEGFNEIASFMDAGEGTIEESETEDVDWVNNWKQYFKPFSVDDVIIKPTWEEVDKADEGKIIINIDPGTAFGTGMHETTQLIIRELRKYIKGGEKVLDVGCGSGILAISALTFGADSAFGTDLDPCAITASHENTQANGIDPARFTVVEGNIIDDEKVKEQAGYGCYDIAVANILADVIMPLSKVIAPHIKKGGLFISSGIIDMKEKDVVDTIKANSDFEIIEVNHQGEWVSVTARRL